MELIINYSDINIRIAGTKIDPLFCGKDVCKILDIDNHRHALSKLDDDYRDWVAINDSKKRLRDMIFINEGGLYALIFKSRKKEAVEFQKWVCMEVLPSIRKYGKYPVESLKKNIIPNNKLYIGSEKDLHYQVVKFIRNKLSDYFIISPTLGENQDSDIKRMDSYNKGYTKGSPDIILIGKDKRGKYEGLAIELKNPNGTNDISEHQDLSLQKFKDKNYKVIVSNSYTDIVYSLSKYIHRLDEIDDDNIMRCNKCKKIYKTKKYFLIHLEKCL